MIGISELTINGMRSPVGLEEKPSLSWKIISDHRNTAQSAYRIQIAKDEAFRNIVWDSGRVEDERSQHVDCDITPDWASRYFARVRVEAMDELSEWSETRTLITGLCGEKWRGKYITAENPPCPDVSKCTYVRGSFCVDDEVDFAVMYTHAKGVYVPYLNGQRATEDLLAPGWTSYHKHDLYQANDVTKLIRFGENAVGAEIGAGWYKGKMSFLLTRNNYGTQTAFLCEIVIRYKNGRVQIVGSGEGWLGSDSPVTFSEIYDGEHYDARMEQGSWCAAQFNPIGWKEVSVTADCPDSLVAQPGGRIRCGEIRPAVKLYFTPKGERVVDFGQILTGWPQVTIRGERDREVALQCFETLDFDGNVYTENLRTAKQMVRYICASDSETVFHPNFTYYGFRYLHLIDWPEDAKADDFKAWVIYTDMTQTGMFECSNPLVNQLHQNIGWGMKSNFLDVPTDCPQRDERMGWTGDAQIFCRTSSFLMDVDRFYRKWLKDLRADQQPDGGVSHIVPDMITGHPETKNNWLLSQGTHSAAGWADAAVICPWTLYMTYGDVEVLRESYDSMKAWIDFMQTHAEDNIWNYKLQFGDWVALDAEPGSYFGATPNALTCTAYYAYSTSLFAKTARLLGHVEDAKKYEALHDKIVEKFRETFFTENGEMTAQTQTAHILALHFDLVEPKYRTSVARRLNELLQKENGHLVTGFMGTTFFTHVLANNGYIDAAYDLLLKDDYPSWLYQVKMGATTVWEHWDGMRPDGSMWSADMNSFNHYAYGSVGEWMYSGIAGLNADSEDPGYHHALLRPKISRRMEHAGASLETVYGKLALSWKWDGEEVCLRVEVPANARATLILERVKAAECCDGVRFFEDCGLQKAELGSGCYTFTTQYIAEEDK